MRNIAFGGVLLAVMAASLFAADADTVTTSRLNLQVVAGENKKPVPNAHVVVRFVQKKFLKDKRTSWETKTNRKGFVVLDKIPHGTIKIQIIARGYQTYGSEHELSKPNEELTILLNPPQSQYSAY
ncbi:MAG: carboxypeptidase regulatory-like domain-containing protein [Acidobacteria bacterium]|nr:carboxypeptidase regulatory-like domain-containing protein [Acidobacteriota bacterium]MCZ6491006.1 carboxypeptidase-like regulatory domain-containing protein [Acidobacteriota bacterium]MCZ6752961.1 carboxypeptidase-like regulatory domain-containing protein [Acidobacteriota bacterium]